MVNTEKLNDLIKRSGLKREAIAKALGISVTTLKTKTDGIADFKSEEVCALKKLFNLSLEDIGELFFEAERDLKSHESEKINDKRD